MGLLVACKGLNLPKGLVLRLSGGGPFDQYRTITGLHAFFSQLLVVFSWNLPYFRIVTIISLAIPPIVIPNAREGG
jgi:hypothetical protein